MTRYYELLRKICMPHGKLRGSFHHICSSCNTVSPSHFYVTRKAQASFAAKSSQPTLSENEGDTQNFINNLNFFALQALNFHTLQKHGVSCTWQGL